MYSNKEAQVALVKCKEGNKLYGVRFEKNEFGWKYDWAFKLSERRASSENYSGTRIKGSIYPDPEYPGCPYCGAKFFIICGCGRLNCCKPGQKVYTCNWCGVTGELEDYKGGGFSSAGDI